MTYENNLVVIRSGSKFPNNDRAGPFVKKLKNVLDNFKEVNRSEI